MLWYSQLRHLRKALDKRRPRPSLPPFDLEGQAAGDRIRAMIDGPEPCMVSRFGGVEMRVVTNYLGIRAPGRLDQKLRRYLRGQAGPWWWDERTAREMIRQAGFFPVDPESLERFALLFMEDSREVDLLGSLAAEEQTMPVQRRPCRIPFIDLEPYRHADPWSAALAGRRVLVVHPFRRTIESQYRNRAALFKDPRVLPAFDLVTFPAVQSVGGVCPDFPDWFAALDWMKAGIAALDFDVALIGAGAYGMALAAFIKRDLERKAVHLGGATQILFGIRGRRWDRWPEYSEGLYNDAWVRPAPEEVPPTADRVEGGCYW
ncbi:MAG: hypothetical protein ABSH53_18155 [Holophaga sp.]|jgi:hypothetical protein